MMQSLPNQVTAQDNDINSVEATLRQELAKLDIKRKTMEHEADAIFLELTTPPEEGVPPMGIDTPLVDQDGYPRGDIDIYRTRTMRGRFRTLKMDHKEISSEIENILLQLTVMKNPTKEKEEQKEGEARRLPKPKPKYDPVTGKWVVMNWDGTVAGIPGGENRKFAELNEQLSGLTGEECEEAERDAISSLGSSPVNSTRSVNTADHEPRPPAMAAPRSRSNTGNTSTTVKLPFARVDAVAAESPAEQAGLKEEDLIVSFGPLHKENHDHLRAIAELVPEMASEKKSIEICLLRRKVGVEWETLHFKLTPRPWNGRGLLGCHLMPYDTADRNNV